MATQKTTTRKTTKASPGKPQSTEAKDAEAQAQAQPAEATPPNADNGAQVPEAGGIDQGDTAQDAPKEVPHEAKDAEAGQASAEVSSDGQGQALPPVSNQEREAPGTEGIPAVFVRTRKRYGSRRRAGHRFTREGFGIALSALSDEQLAQLQADPALEVEACTFPAEPDGDDEA